MNCPLYALLGFDQLNEQHSWLWVVDTHMRIGQDSSLLQPLALQPQLWAGALAPEVTNFADFKDMKPDLHGGYLPLHQPLSVLWLNQFRPSFSKRRISQW